MKKVTVNDFNKQALNYLEGNYYEPNDKWKYPVPGTDVEKEAEYYDYVDTLKGITYQSEVDGNIKYEPSQTIFGEKQLTEKDLQIIKFAHENREKHDFLNYYSNLYYNANPANKKLLDSIYPEFLQSVEKNLEHKAALVARWQTLKLINPESPADVLLLFLVKKKGLPEPNFRFWLPNKVDPSATSVTHAFKYGNQYSFYVSKAKRDEDNKFDKRKHFIQPKKYPRFNLMGQMTRYSKAIIDTIGNDIITNKNYPFLKFDKDFKSSEYQNVFAKQSTNGDLNN